jgi:hypothetical protein
MFHLYSIWTKHSEPRTTLASLGNFVQKDLQPHFIVHYKTQSLDAGLMIVLHSEVKEIVSHLHLQNVG